MSEHWGVWFAVTGDLRFLGHHDLMRLMARAAARASVPIKHSEGFNPRPKLSLVLPRPVGVASRCELMAIHLTRPVDPDQLRRDLNEQLPEGIAVREARPLPSRKPPQARRVGYEVTLTEEESASVAEHIAALAGMDRWEVTQPGRPGRSGRPERTVDLAGRAEGVTIEGRTLRFVLLPAPDAPARCIDMLALLGLTAPAASATEALAKATRTDIEYDLAATGP